MKITEVIETAEWLGKNSDADILKKLKELSDNQRFFVTVWGHYSAGKSRLINNIFERDILPVQTRETTAVLTYIQYGTKEECVLIYDDGMAKSYDLSVLKDIFQNTEKFEEIGKIDHIEVYIDNDLLNTGLILVDTPGINTVIQKHQDLAIDAIEQSGRIIYVLGNSPTNVDRSFIKQISDCGVKISFVRTKCDRIIESEEDPDVSIKKEYDDLSAFIGDKIDFIPLSNEGGNRWSKNIDAVRKLVSDISISLTDSIENAINDRIDVYRKRYMLDISTIEEDTKNILNGNNEKIDSEIAQCNANIKRLESIMSDIKTKIESKVESAKQDSKKELGSLISSRIDDFSDAISYIEAEVSASENIKSICLEHVFSTIEMVKSVLNSYFEDIIKDETEDLAKCASDYQIDISAPTYSEVLQDNSRIINLYNSKRNEASQQLEAIKAMIEENAEELSNVKAELNDNDFDGKLAVLEQELAQIPSDMALRLSDNQSIQPSEVLKHIGDAADLALLLVPGDMIFNGIKTLANTDKIAQILHKSGKLGEAITKAGKAVGENAKVIDRIRDTSYTLNQIMKKRKYSTKQEKAAAEMLVNKVAEKGQRAYEKFKDDKKSGNVFDALSIAYWTEKLGKNFDSAPKMEIDYEEESLRNQKRKEITAQQKELSNKKIQLKQELGLLSDKESELRLRKQEEELTLKNIEKALEEQEQSIVQQARIAALDKYKKEYKDYYNKNITAISNKISERYFETASQNITMHIAGKCQEVSKSIEGKKEQLENLISLKEKGEEEVGKRLQECEAFKNKVAFIN